MKPKRSLKISCRCRASPPHPLDAGGLSKRRFNARHWLTPAALGETKNVLVSNVAKGRRKSDSTANNCRCGNKARFRTWSRNGEFFRRGCLSIVCKCFFSASGVERTDVDEQNRNGSENVTKLEPKGYQNEPKCYQDTIINRCLKKVAKVIEQVRNKMLSHNTLWEP